MHIYIHIYNTNLPPARLVCPPWPPTSTWSTRANTPRYPICSRLNPKCLLLLLLITLLFCQAGVPPVASYLKLVYSGEFAPLPNLLTGETFSRVFGTHSSCLELLLIKRRISGPCWLSLTGVAAATSSASWAKYEVHTHCICIYMYICVYVCIYTYIHIYPYIHIYIY